MTSGKLVLTRELLVAESQVQGMRVAEIALRHSVRPGSVYGALKRLGISRRRRSKYIVRAVFRETEAVKQASTSSAVPCSHHWSIESPSKEINEGKTSRGVCKFCHQEREFVNAVPENKKVRPLEGILRGTLGYQKI